MLCQTLNRILACSVILVSLCIAFLQLGHAAESPDGIEFFEKRIRPLFVEHCYKCHSASSEKVKGELLLDSREGWSKGGQGGPVIIPGDAERSRLIETVRHKHDDLKMQPKKKLQDSQIADLVTWINLGAPDPRTATTGPTSQGPSQGASNHWAFRAVKNPSLPAVKNKRWPQTPIDVFILAKLEAKGLVPADRADKRTLLRRATYDLTGLPPTQAEVDAFMADRSSGAFGKVVDRLLASPHYGERWGRYWLDVARYADTKGYVYSDREEPRFMHSATYRDWVIHSLNDDLPYDRFLLLQLAADQLVGRPANQGLPRCETNDLAAMGFLTLGRRFLGVVHDIIDDRIDVVMRGTQALTVGCARCHDHKFDPIPTKDYYSLYGVFAGCTEKVLPLAPMPVADPRSEFEKGQRERMEKYAQTLQKKREDFSNRFRARTPDYLMAVLEARNLPSEEFYEIRGPDDLNPTVVRSWEAYIHSTKSASNLVFSAWHALEALPARDFSSKAGEVLARLRGADSTSPVINPLILRALSESPLVSMKDTALRYGRVLADAHHHWRSLLQTARTNQTEMPQRLPDTAEEEVRFVLYGPQAPVNIPPLAAADLEWYFDEPTRVELMKLNAEIERWIIKSTSAPPHAVILEDRATQKTQRVFVRGNPANKGEEVPRQFLAALSGSMREPFKNGSGRLELARAITSRDNPLTARVLVNRVWLHHFGTGLVRTPSDFGLRSELPSHPELLDWLAARFMDEGWSLKRLHRLIMLSSVYQQSSDAESGPLSRASTSSSPAAMAGDSETKRRTSSRSNRPSAQQVDPENRLLSHFNRHRLDFEAVRDSFLAASGELDTRLGGPSVDLFKQPFTPRRTAYGFIDRQFLPGLMRIFDFANPDMHSPQRSDTTVPQQALFLMNSPFVVERSRAVARRVANEAETDRSRVEALYRVLFQREPTGAQLQDGLSFVKAAQALPGPEPPKPVAPVWLYGFGEFDTETKRIINFTTLPRFANEAWQSGDNWPDEKLGWVRLTAEGGHTGNDLQHAAIRRWVAPLDAVVSIGGTIQHEHKEGDGIQARIISSRRGLLGSWALHNEKADAKVDSLEVQREDTIDFIVDFRANLSNDDFKWAPTIKVIKALSPSPPGVDVTEWNAKKDFSGPPAPPPRPLAAWEKYAQVLLLSNEFVFVD